MPKVEKMERIVTMMPSSLVRRITATWHKRQLRNLSATIRALIEEALEKSK